MYKIKIFFPCDFEVRSDKEKNKLTKLGFLLKTSGDSSTEVKNNGISASFYSFLSPSVSINNPDEIVCISTMNPDDHKNIVNDILVSCCLESDVFRKVNFTITDILYPYGIGLSAQLKDIKLVNKVISGIENEFEGFKLNDKNENERPEWIIYSKPIILVECDASSGLPTLDMEFPIDNKDNKFLVGKLKIGNEVIFSLDGELEESINTSIALLTAIKHTSSYVRVWSKGINYREDRDEIIKNIHIYCAVFEEMQHSTILRRKNDKVVYDLLYSAFDIEKIGKQINAAREYADYLINDVTNIETQKINKTVFITGYIGLILSFFAFVPIQLKSIFWVDQPLGTFEKIISSFALIGLVLVFCKIVLLLHKKRSQSHKIILSLINTIRTIVKKFRKVLPALLTIVIYLSLALSIVGFVVFVLRGMFKFV